MVDPDFDLSMFPCPNCGRETRMYGEVCRHCNHPLTHKEMPKGWEEIVDAARKTGDWSKVPRDAMVAHTRGIVLTTLHFVSGREIEKEIEIVSAECAFGMNIFRDLLAGVRDIVGGRSGSIQTALKDIKKTVLNELRREAFLANADAVLGVRLDYSEISGGGKVQMLFAVATGTAVKLK